MTRHVAIYLRVSTNSQTTKSQEPDLDRWRAAQDEPVVVYSDKATGTKMDRPAWRRLEESIRSGRVSKLVVWRLDRLGRTVSGLSLLFEELERLGVVLVSLRDGVDLSTPAGRLMANVVASVAVYETELRGERVRAGQDAARARGKKWGGSKKGKRKKVTRPQERAIVRMFEAGEGPTAIARSFGLSRPTIYDVLRAAGVK